jgi:drug/metabolite transporter (DMT)-like permease
MNWVMFAIGAALSWGMYGPMLHKGQVALGNPMRALLCVGVAYLLVAILIPGGTLVSQGQLNYFNWGGTVAATFAGVLGAFGAIFVIWAFRAGGVPNYVMPIVFGIAPLVNVLYTMYSHPPQVAPNPLLYVGFLLAAVGAGMVLYFKPQG